MSGYPPGVTGNEPAIAGYPEGTYSITCKGYMPPTAKVAPRDIFEQIVAIANLIGSGAPERASYRLGQLHGELLQMPEAVDVACNFEGEVDAWFSGGKDSYTAHWECPRCGTEDEEDRDRDDDNPNL